MPDTIIGTRIAHARESRGWSARLLSRETGVDAQTIRELERGHTKYPGFVTMCRLCDVLGLPVEQIARLALDADDKTKNVQVSRRKRDMTRNPPRARKHA